MRANGQSTVRLCHDTSGCGCLARVNVELLFQSQCHTQHASRLIDTQAARRIPAGIIYAEVHATLASNCRKLLSNRSDQQHAAPRVSTSLAHK